MYVGGIADIMLSMLSEAEAEAESSHAGNGRSILKCGIITEPVV